MSAIRSAAQLRRAAMACGALLLAAPADTSGQTQAGWRYWAPADGIQESHSRGRVGDRARARRRASGR